MKVSRPTNQSLPVMYETLSFPLNVYAKLLQLDGKPVDYLHFGLFETADEDVYSAQQRSTDLIFDHLPKAPASILEVGMGLGTLQKILLEKGYRAQGITPDRPQYEIARHKLGDSATIHCTGFETFRTEVRFDTIISQESAQYIDILELLPKVNSLLKPGGRFILLDEVCLHSDEPGNEALHNPRHIKFLACALGMELRYEQDLALRARYSMNYLAQRLTRYREIILRDLEIGEEQLRELETAMARYISRYRDGGYGYTLMVFGKAGKDVPHVGYFSAEGLAGLQELSPPRAKQRLTSLWHWKNREKRLKAIACWQKGRLKSYSEGTLRDILYFGQFQSAMQIGKAFSTEAQSAAADTKLDQIFQQRFIGYGAPCLLAYGCFKPDTADQAHPLYDSAGRLSKLRWRRAKKMPMLRYKIRTLDEDDVVLVDTLWQRMADHSGDMILGVRDWDYLRRRYLEYPGKGYILLKLLRRLNAQAVAVVVLKEEVSCCQLVDFIGAPKNLPAGLQAARRYAASRGLDEVHTLASDMVSALLKAAPATSREAQCWIPAGRDGPTPAEINGKWWLMPGDWSE
ncbi:MAG: methyltransferase domain-containing protein [Pseudohongiellaceae bacterium]